MSNKVKKIALSGGKFAIVDAENYEWLNQYKWRLGEYFHGYSAARTIINNEGKRVVIYMHREIMNAPSDMDVNHRNRNRLDNRKANLRLCTIAQSQYGRRSQANTTSRFKGVCWNRRERKWRAYIKHNGKRYHLGRFEDELEAASAYDAKATELFGEFARLNVSLKKTG